MYINENNLRTDTHTRNSVFCITFGIITLKMVQKRVCITKEYWSTHLWPLSWLDLQKGTEENIRMF